MARLEIEPEPLPGGRPARTPAGTVVYALGDLHGRCDLLEALLPAIAADAAGRAAPRRVLVYLGDYLARGPASRQTVERVLGWRPAGFEVVTLRGNHEDLVLRWLDGERWAGRHWFDYDGLEALLSYGVQVPDREARDDRSLEALRAAFRAALPAEHLAFFRSLRVSHREGDYRFVHGGVRPGVPFDEQSEDDLMWIREPFLASDADHGAVVVHGHSVARTAQVRPNRIGIDTAAARSGVLTCLVLEGAARQLLQTAPGG